MDHSSDDDDDFLPSIANFNNMFSAVHQQARKEAASKAQLSPVPVSTQSSSKTSKNEGDLKTKSTSSSSSAKKASSKKLTKVKPDPPSSPPVSDDDLDDLIAQANTFIKIAKSSSKSSSQNENTSLKTKGPSRNEDIGDVSSGSTKTAVASSSKGKTKRHTTRSKDFPESVADLGPAVKKGKQSSTQKAKKQVEEVVLSSGDEGVENVDKSSVLTEEVKKVPNDNTSCTVRLRWKEEIIRFSVPNGTKLSQIRMDVATKLSVRADNLLILDEEGSTEVSDDTLVENLPFGILEVFEKQSVATTNNAKKMAMDPDWVQVKVQGCGGYRQRLVLFIKKTTHVQQLVDDFVGKYGLQGKQFKLVFDGEDVGLTETAESLELEGGEMLDIVEIKPK